MNDGQAPVPDPRAEAPREPVPVTPVPPRPGFRRTMHVAAGPRPGADWGSGIDVPRVLHGRCRDVALDADGGEQVVAEAGVRGATDAALHLEQLDLDGAPGPDASALLGLRAGPGLRGAVASLVADPTDAVAAVLLDVGIGGNLSNYARMQAARESGLLTIQAMRPGALDRMAGSCRGWAADGDLVAALRAGTERPSRRPPEVAPDRDGWHDLGSWGPGWVRRRRRLDVAPTHAGLRVAAAFRDSWVAPEGSEHALHEWDLDLVVAPDGTVTAATATPRSLPFGACPFVAPEVGGLVGVPVAELRRRGRDVLGGEAGCTHLDDLVSVVPAAVAAATRHVRAG